MNNQKSLAAELESLKALSARIRRIDQLLDTGDTERAHELLRGLVSILPAHERRRWEAAAAE